MSNLALSRIESGTSNENTQSPSRWPAKLELSVQRTFRGSRLVKNRHQGPLYVQKPFYPEGDDLAHIYLLHPPGGIVSGDDLSINIDIDQHASALFTTPGAGRVYKAREDRTLQRQHVHINVAQHAHAEWFPLENIVYPGAFGKLTTRVDLDQDASFMGWEISCMGLPASRFPFQSGEFKQRLEIYRQGKLALIENINVSAKSDSMMHSAAGLQRHCVNGIFIASSTDKGVDHEELLSRIREVSTLDGDLLAVTHVGDFIVVRYLGECAHRARHLFVQCWDVLRQAMKNRPSCEPRIWMT